MWEMQVQSLGWDDPVEKEMATHSSILAWKIPWTEEPGGLWFMESLGYDLAIKPPPPFLFLVRNTSHLGFPDGTSGKEPACQCRRCKKCGFNSWVGKILWRKAWPPTPVFLPGESLGHRRLVGYSTQGLKELGTTEVTLHAYTQLSFASGFFLLVETLVRLWIAQDKYLLLLEMYPAKLTKFNELGAFFMNVSGWDNFTSAIL